MSVSAVHPSEALLTAIYDALKADATLRTLIETYRGGPAPNPLPIYESAAPPDEPFPYLTFNEAADTDWDVSEAYGRELLIDLHAWTLTGSSLQARRLLRRCELLLRDQALTMADANLVHLRAASIRTAVEDGTIRHGTLTLRAIVEEL